MERPLRLSGSFVRSVKEVGRYGDGRGGYGLSLMVQPTANGRLSKSWAQRLRIAGRPVNVGLGVYPIVTLDRAREQAFGNMLGVREGRDPRLERRKAAIPTFARAAERVIDLHRGKWKHTSKTEKSWRARLEEYVFPVIGQLRIDAVTPSDIVEVLTPIWTSKREVARKVLQHMRKVFDWGLAQQFVTYNVAAVATPAMPTRMARVVHQRALAPSDVPAALATVLQSDAARDYPAGRSDARVDGGALR